MLRAMVILSIILGLAVVGLAGVAVWLASGRARQAALLAATQEGLERERAQATSRIEGLERDLKREGARAEGLQVEAARLAEQIRSAEEKHEKELEKERDVLAAERRALVEKEAALTKRVEELNRQAADTFRALAGKALSDSAAADVKILVVGNPANTNCLIAMSNAPRIPAHHFSAMTRLDHNRATAQLAKKAGATVDDVARMTIWGNHSATQYPDLFHAEVNGKPALEAIGGDRAWVETDFIPTVQQRGAKVIEARGASSAASAANAAVCQMRDLMLGTPAGDWVSMAVPSDGSYGIPEGVLYSYPVTTKAGEYEIVQGLDIDDFSRQRMDATKDELFEERSAVEELGLV